MDDLYRAILERPGDGVLRLVYADWLEEKGDYDRAEFIRLQIFQGEDKTTSHKFCRQLAKGKLLAEVCPTCRIQELIHRAPDSWIGETDELFPAREVIYHIEGIRLEVGWTDGERLVAGGKFVDGFIGKVWCHESDWEKYSKELTAIQPITEVRFLIQGLE